MVSNLASRSALFAVSMLALGTSDAVHAQTDGPAIESAAKGGQAVAAGEIIPGEIVVTAQRRSDSIQRIPLAVSAISNDLLDAAQIRSTTELSRVVPALRTYPNSGNSLGGAYFIRGVGQDDSSPLADPPVGVYVDDVFLARQWINNAQLYDLERVEILRGPQGVLYGRNTTGGAIRQVTVKPSAGFYGTFDGAYGNYNAINVKGVLNGQLATNIYGRITAYHESRDSISKNVQTGQDNYSRNNQGARLQLRYDNQSGIVDDIAFAYLRSRTPGDVGSNFLVPGSDLFHTRSGNDNFSHLDGYIISNTLAYGRESVTVRSISAFTDTRWDYSLDFSGSPSPIFVYNAEQANRTYSQEFQANASLLDDRLMLTAGLFGFYETNEVYDERELFAGASQSFNRFKTSIRSLAAYGQAEFKITPTLTLIGGLRYTDEVRKLRRLEGGTGSFDVFRTNYTEATVAAAGNPLRLKTTKLNPKVGVQFQPTPTAMFYATYTEGFRSGSYAQRQYSAAGWRPYDAETVDATEIGAKLQFFDRRLTLNLAGYENKYKDFIGATLDPVTNANLTGNTGDVRWRGIEADTRIAVSERLTLTGGLEIARSKVLFAIPGSAIDGDSVLDQTPKFTGNVGYDFDFGPVFNEWSLRFTGNYYHRSKLTSGATTEKVPYLDLFDFSILTSSPDKNTTFTLYCRNCTNQHYFTTLISATALGIYNKTPADPRTYGIRAQHRF